MKFEEALKECISSDHRIIHPGQKYSIHLNEYGQVVDSNDFPPWITKDQYLDDNWSIINEN